MTRNDLQGAVAWSTFTRIDRAVRATPPPPLAVNVDGHRLVLDPVGCRSFLYRPHHDEPLRAAIWRQAITQARREPRDGTGTGRLLAVWLTLPGLRRNLFRILREFRITRADLESEAVLAVLVALDEADPDTSGVGGHIIRAAVNRMWTYAGRVRKEVPVVDVASVARARNTVPPPQEHERRPGTWELCVSPPPDPAGLFATIRFTESRRRLEGERLGALAHSAGLAELVFRARRHEEEELIGTLALRPAGGRR